MSDAFNMTMRKFLKQVGVTSQQAIEDKMREKGLDATAGKSFSAKMVLTVDGLAINARWIRLDIESDESEHWIRLSAEGFGTETTEETLELVDEINRRTQGWVYRVPQYKYASATKRLNDLLADEESS